MDADAPEAEAEPECAPVPFDMGSTVFVEVEVEWSAEGCAGESKRCDAPSGSEREFVFAVLCDVLLLFALVEGLILVDAVLLLLGEGEVVLAEKGV